MNLQTLQRCKREVFNDALPNDRVGGVLSLHDEQVLVRELQHAKKEIRELKRAVRYWESLTHVSLGGRRV